MKKQPKFIAVTLQKGGLGKSAVTVNLAANLCMKKRSKYSDYYNRVLIIDGDVHATASHYLGVYNEQDKGLYDVLTGKCNFDEAIKEYSFEYGTPYVKPFRIDILPSFTFLATIETNWLTYDEPSMLLRKAIEKSEKIMEYDYVLIDCPPEGNCLLSNIYNVCDYYIMPVLPDSESNKNLGITYEQIGVLSSIKKDNKYLGVVINNYQKSDGADFHVEEFQNNPYIHCFDTIIPHSKDYDNSLLGNMPIPLFRKKTNRCIRLNLAFKAFTNEFITEINKE